MNYSVKIENSGMNISVPEGSSLLDVLRKTGFLIDAVCGGNGKCGKCIVEIRMPDGKYQRVHACRYAVECDITVCDPTAGNSGGVNVLTEGIGTEKANEPRVFCRKVHLERGKLGDKCSKWDRLAQLTGVSALPDRQVLQELGAITEGELYAVCTESAVLSVCVEKPVIASAAFDIGTTTIAGYLLDEQGTVIASNGMLNPQTRYGADVISRVDYSVKNGTDELTGIVHEAVDTLLGTLCETAGLKRTDVYSVSIVGNTCMHHLFLGLMPESLGKAPFTSTVSQCMVMKCMDFDVHAYPSAEIIFLPVIAGFIGADTVACAAAAGFDERIDKTLLIDIGTNGEMVMGTKERMVACSTAAGPAFEGARISMGMRGAPGAIDHVWLDENGMVQYHVIGDIPAQGICGSGLIDAVSVLLKTEFIDEMGGMEDDAYTFEGSSVSVTQKDIREVQLAKAAICAGIRLMAKALGWAPEDIQTVLIAGAFGNYLNADSACDIGLIPEELRGRIRGIGNAAGSGAAAVLADRFVLSRAIDLAGRIEFLELALLPEFQDVYVDALAFGDWED